MTLNNLPTQLTALLFSITFTTAVVAQTAVIAKTADLSPTESKANSTDKVVSDANPATNIDSHADDKSTSDKVKSAVIKQADEQEDTTDTQASTTPCSRMSSYQKSIDNKSKPQTMANREMEKFQQMEKQWYQQRREAYKQNLENRNRQMSTDAKARRSDYIKHMEQRREFFNKMNDQRRKDFEQRKADTQQKMHQTSNGSVSAENS